MKLQSTPFDLKDIDFLGDSMGEQQTEDYFKSNKNEEQTNKKVSANEIHLMNDFLNFNIQSEQNINKLWEKQKEPETEKEDGELNWLNDLLDEPLNETELDKQKVKPQCSIENNEELDVLGHLDDVILDLEGNFKSDHLLSDITQSVKEPSHLHREFMKQVGTVSEIEIPRNPDNLVERDKIIELVESGYISEPVEGDKLTAQKLNSILAVEDEQRDNPPERCLLTSKSPLNDYLRDIVKERPDELLDENRELRIQINTIRCSHASFLSSLLLVQSHHHQTPKSKVTTPAVRYSAGHSHRIERTNI